MGEAMQSSSPVVGRYAVCCLHDMTPIVTQYSRLVQFFFIQHIAAVRAVAKLQSILLSIFATIVQKVGDKIADCKLLSLLLSLRFA